MLTNKMIFSLITRIGMHGANVGLWTPILVIKLKIILFVDNSGQEACTFVLDAVASKHVTNWESISCCTSKRTTQR